MCIRDRWIAGPIIAGRPSADIDALARFGDHLGYAFQISDDLLDVTGDAATVGKAVGKDAAAGKALISSNTIISLYGSSFADSRDKYGARKTDLVEGKVPTQLACVAVEGDGKRAPVFYVQNNQINAQAPFLLGGGPVEVRVIRDPGGRNEKRSADGSVNDPKALRSLQDEIEHLSGRISNLEDQWLEATQTVEDATAEATRLASRRSEVEDQMRALLKTRDAAVAEIKTELTDLAARRSTFASQVPDDVMTLYDRVAQRQGTGETACCRVTWLF